MISNQKEYYNGQSLEFYNKWMNKSIIKRLYTDSFRILIVVQ
jgi:hypothetical protein